MIKYFSIDFDMVCSIAGNYFLKAACKFLSLIREEKVIGTYLLYNYLLCYSSLCNNRHTS